ncbi:hypothetical protein E2562_008785 [Oryza meyeriana var. granulata]|uniref:F-box domain-containing protein n=1 Tax=Oryza meyeriana var. granulata TaxID=110450 RepID=A0A6G1D063_9ORYZ|nr:hypothetical protein E2562_008785 [Oryza meyeriana var. granulata]
MVGTPHKRMRCMASANAPGADRLSSLPDDVIARILSSLNAREAARTIVLSRRRWQTLWRELPRINAEFFEFDTDTEGMETVAEDDEVAFKRFVNRLLELRDPAALMEQFWLRYPSSEQEGIQASSSSSEPNRWIGHAVCNHARSLEFISLISPLEIDHAIFASRYLRKFVFFNVTLSQGFFKQLENGCAKLEDLHLDDCVIKDDEISSQAIKVLTINDSDFSCEYQTTIATPAVTSLSLSCHLGSVPLLNDMPALVTASVDLNGRHIKFDAADMPPLLRSLSDVKQLEFDYSGRQLTIDNNLQWCPKFNNLVNLTLGRWSLDANFYALTVFLQNSPTLEKLTLKLGEFDLETPERIIGELEERSFTCERLKSVEVICLEDDLLANRVEGFFVNNDMTSVQIDIKHLNWKASNVTDVLLSPRWRNLWRFMPCINADLFDFSRETENLEKIVKAEVMLKRFVNRLLELQDPTTMVDTFWLRYSRSDEHDIQPASAEASRWISYAIQKHAWSVELVAMLSLEVDHTKTMQSKKF